MKALCLLFLVALVLSTTFGVTMLPAQAPAQGGSGGQGGGGVQDAGRRAPRLVSPSCAGG